MPAIQETWVEIQLPRCLSGKLPANAVDVDSIPVSGRSPGKEMAPHSSILAWRIPWTQEPGGIQPMMSQTVRHDLGKKNNNKGENTDTVKQW